MSALPTKIGLIGVGLIGGSLALALRNHGYTGDLYAYDHNPETAGKIKGINGFLSSPAQVLERCDMVVIATPVGACRSILQAMRPVWSADKTVSDVGSVKQSLIKAARDVFGKVPPNLVPAHPIAGDEKSGPTAARAELFSQCCTLLTPLEHTQASAVTRVRLLWESAGARTECIAADEHDHLLAQSSHLPHLAAYALMDSLLAETDGSQPRYLAGGLRDFTRVAGSDPIMWRDICLHNGDHLLEALHRFQASLNSLRTAIERRDGEALEALFAAARKRRRSLSSPVS